MNEENKVSYYAIIPATVRYDKKLKANEKLLYGEITSLCNKSGYCYAQNRYFAELYNVSQETVSRWISNLENQGYIKTEINRNERQEVISRYIYIESIPYCQNNQYPYCQKDQEGIDEKVKENNININKIDDLFYLIINRSYKIPNRFYEILNKVELDYNQDVLKYIKGENLEMIKIIIYILYDIYNSNSKKILNKINRNKLINLYKISKDYMPQNLLKYYKKSIINEYSNTS